MHYNMSHAYDLRATGLAHRQSKPNFRQKPQSSSYPRPFDPDELSRRLFVVLAEQKAYSERKRRARADANKAAQQTFSGKLPAKTSRPKQEHSKPREQRREEQSGSRSQTDTERAAKDKSRRKSQAPRRKSEADEGLAEDGHYIPQVAAAQFERTTISEVVLETSQVHKLSKKAMKFHMDGPNAALEGTSPTDTSPLAQAQAIQRVRSTRERQYERNQFQHPSSFGAVTEDIVPPEALKQRRTFDTPSSAEQQAKEDRRKSTGSILAKDSRPVLEEALHNFSFIDKQPAMDATEVAQVAEAHRVDWTQSDEPAVQPKTSPQLRKTESRWTLRGRLGSLGKQGGKENRDEKPAPVAEETSELGASPKSPKPGFFSRFKR